MLQKIKHFFGVGKIKISNKNNIISFLVRRKDDCLIIKNHFINYPLLTYKSVHFKLWCNALDIVINKTNYTDDVLLKILANRGHMPKGISEKHKNAFPLVEVGPKPEYNPDLTKINIDWIAGFINADGHYGLGVFKTSKPKIGERVVYKIQIIQHNNSIIVLEKIKEFLQIGTVFLDKRAKPSNASNFIISSIKEINLFIELFKSTYLLGAKALDYVDFCKGIQIINNKEHLTQ